MKNRVTIPATLVVCFAALAVANDPKRIEHDYELGKLRFEYLNAEMNPARLGEVFDSDNGEPAAVDPNVTIQSVDDSAVEWLKEFAEKGEPKIDAEPLGTQGSFRVAATDAQHRRIEKAIEARIANEQKQISCEIRTFMFPKGEDAFDPELRDTLRKSREQAVELDDAQVAAITEAAVKQVGAVQTTAPRVTMFSDQRAYVIVSSDCDFIADYQRDDAGKDWVEVKRRFQTGQVIDVHLRIVDGEMIAADVHCQHARLVELRKEPFKNDPKLSIESPQVEIWETLRPAIMHQNASTLFLVPPSNAVAKDDPTRVYTVVRIVRVR